MRRNDGEIDTYDLVRHLRDERQRQEQAEQDWDRKVTLGLALIVTALLVTLAGLVGTL